MTRILAGCKINLGLRITGVRPDGYHEIDSLFVPVPEPKDELIIEELAGDPAITVFCGLSAVDPHKNTLTRAYAAFTEKVPGVPALAITLNKGVPAGAGLGGGSSDAAALLRWLNERMGHPLNAPALAQAALAVGADTPFFLHDGPCRVRGIGEIIEPVAQLPCHGTCVLVCPGIHIDTAGAYALWDRAARTPPQIQGPHGLTKQPLTDNEICSNVRNDLESVILPLHPELSAIKTALCRHGADVVCMSGSGSSIFGIFGGDSKALAEASVNSFTDGGNRVFHFDV